MKKRKIIYIIVICIIFPILYIAYPYWSLITLVSAIEEGDREKIEEKIDFPKVRESLKEDFKAELMNSLLNDDMKDNIFGGIALVFVPALIDSLMDNYLTPTGISKLIKEGEIEDKKNREDVSQIDSSVEFPDLKWAFFKSPMRFKAILKNNVELKLELQGTSWRLTRITVPLDDVEKGKQDVARIIKSSIKNTLEINSDSENTKEELVEFREKQEYLPMVKLYDFEATTINTFSKKEVPSVKFKIKNEGNKTLNKVKVTVYFKDSNDIIITEEDFTPVNVSSWSMDNKKPLKPNYIWEAGEGNYYTVENIPSEWETGNAVAKITDIEIKK